MMLTAMHHLDAAAYACVSPSSASASPWPQQLFPAADRGHVRYDYDDLASVAAAPPAAMTRAPAHHKRQVQQQQRGAARRVAKRRPRPSQRLPTTYISADPAEFRRMVQQVTGADDAPPQEEELFCRPALAGAAAPPVASGGALLLPTLDTSAFLLGRAARPAAFRTETAPPQLPACDGSLELDNAGGSSNCGFPTLESSWDLL